MKCDNCGMEVQEDDRFCGDCGAMIGLPPPLDEQPPPRLRSPYKLRINILCLIGGILAVVSLFLPWVLVQDWTGDDTAYGAFELDEPLDSYRMFPDGLRYSMAVFMVGTALALVTPLGGIPLLIGSTGFIFATATTKVYNVEMMFWLGALVGLVSSLIVIASLFEPVGKGFEPVNENRVLARLLVWGVYQ